MDGVLYLERCKSADDWGSMVSEPDYGVMPDGQSFIMLDTSASEPLPRGLVPVRNRFQ